MKLLLLFSTLLVASPAWAIDLSEMQIEELKKDFVYIDGDGDGSITKPELDVFLQKLGHAENPDEKLQHLVDFLDKDGSGTINEMEFVSGLPTKPGLKLSFDAFDKTEDGLLSKADLKHLSDIGFRPVVTDKQIEAFVTALDMDDDGQINLKEFAAAIQQRTTGPIYYFDDDERFYFYL